MVDYMNELIHIKLLILMILLHHFVLLLKSDVVYM